MLLENLYQTAGPKKPRELIMKSLRDKKEGKRYMIRHVMSDGSVRDSIEGYVVPKESPVYGVLKKAYEEGIMDQHETVNDIAKTSEKMAV